MTEEEGNAIHARLAAPEIETPFPADPAPAEQATSFAGLIPDYAGPRARQAEGGDFEAGQ